MNFTFLTQSGTVAFYRNDAEQAEWCQDEMTVNATFPYVAGKAIERGMVLLFQDPLNSSWQAFEIRSVTSHAADMFQQITAESLAISELTDVHISNDRELTDISAEQALQSVLSGSGWKVGTAEQSEISSADIYRGSVWQGIRTICENWNVYITPRVNVNSTGITGKYLDISSTEGKWNGLRLSIDKNMLDPSVTYDDTDLYTAFYGYGGSYTDGDETKETVFDSVVWAETSEHPAKPAGQRYIVDPEKTELYGRNGKPRFGYYQNSDIDDAEILLEKTWEALKQCSSPKINIKGTLTDLKRLGYNDVPIQLHDMAIIDIKPLGIQEYRQVIKYTIDLLDPSNNTPEIGDYIQNIIYISRETEDFATGGSSASAGGGSRAKKTQDNFKTTIDDNGRRILLNAQHIGEHSDILQQAGMEIDPITGVLIYAEDNENNIGSMFHVQSDRITAEVTERKAEGNVLSSRITQTANSIALEVSERKAGDASLSSRINIEKDRITAEVTRAKGAENTLSGRLTITENAITQEVTDRTNADSTLSGRITVNASAITAEVTRATGVESSLSGRLTITENAITQEVTDRTSADTTLSGRITVNADAITSEVTRATAAEGTLSSSITQTATEIRSEVSVSEAGLQSQITQNADQIELKVSKNGVISSINQTAESITISASKVNLNGYVTSSMLESAFTSAQQISTQQMTISQYFTCLGYNVSWKSYSARFCSLSGEHTFKDTSGTSYTGRLVTDYSGTTLYYLGR